jgi:hypothetical protein
MIKITKWILLGLAFLIFFAFFVPSCKKEHRQKEKAKEKAKIEQENDPIPSSGNNQILEEMETAFIGPGDSWETGYIDYKFRFRTNGHSIYISFTSKNGGWTKPFFQDKDFEGDIPIPSDIADKNKRKIKAKVTAGPEETTPFKVWLYKRK